MTGPQEPIWLVQFPGAPPVPVVATALVAPALPVEAPPTPVVADALVAPPPLPAVAPLALVTSACSTSPTHSEFSESAPPQAIEVNNGAAIRNRRVRNRRMSCMVPSLSL